MGSRKEAVIARMVMAWQLKYGQTQNWAAKRFWAFNPGKSMAPLKVFKDAKMTG